MLKEVFLELMDIPLVKYIKAIPGATIVVAILLLMVVVLP